MVQKVHEILPVSKVVVEVAAFDIQKIKAVEAGLPVPEGEDYMKGEKLGKANVREYVLFRDGHICQCCKGKSGDKILSAHHIESRQTGGDAPNNMVTLCKYCHVQYHKGNIQLPTHIKRGASFRDAAFMGIMRWAFYNRLKEMYPNVSLTYGYITKNTRIDAGLPKEHYIDALCVAGHPKAKLAKERFMYRKVRRHNRQVYKDTIYPGGTKRKNSAPYKVKGFCLNDRVRVQDKEYYIHGRRLTGSFVLKTLTGQSKEIVPSKLTLIGHQHGFLCERVVA